MTERESNQRLPMQKDTDLRNQLFGGLSPSEYGTKFVKDIVKVTAIGSTLFLGCLNLVYRIDPGGKEMVDEFFQRVYEVFT